MNDLTEALNHPAKWWSCPNVPKCPHGALFHDVNEMDDPLPRCCVEGCDCGKTAFPLLSAGT